MGGWQWNGGPIDTQRFVDRDYQDWLERLRNAEALLPENNDIRNQLELIRTRIEEMRRDYRRHSLAPKFDLLLAEVINPLAETADELDREIQKILKVKEFVLTDDGSIPSKYRKSVAEYFEALSNIEIRQ